MWLRWNDAYALLHAAHGLNAEEAQEALYSYPHRWAENFQIQEWQFEIGPGPQPGEGRGYYVT